MTKYKKTFTNYMQIAINIAKKEANKTNKKIQEIPVGCVIVDNFTGKIVASSCNKTRRLNNPIQHAEIICINKKKKKYKSNRLERCSIYITLEPCGMCTAAIALAKIDSIYIGCLSKKTGAIVSNINYFNSSVCNHKPKIYYPIMEQECINLIQTFFNNLN